MSIISERELLEHRIRVRLAELELAQSAIRRLTYYKVLADRVRVAEAALQRIGIEESAATRGLKRNCGNVLPHLGDVRRGGARLSLLFSRWGFTRARLRPEAGQDLQRERPCCGKLRLSLSECELKLRVGRQRGRRNAAHLLYRLPSYFIQGTTGDAERDSIENVFVPDKMTFSFIDCLLGNAVTGGAAVRLAILGHMPAGR